MCIRDSSTAAGPPFRRAVLLSTGSAWFSASRWYRLPSGTTAAGAARVRMDPVPGFHPQLAPLPE
eukprot:1274983-Alexandrium_andersonii.AAC.1